MRWRTIAACIGVICLLANSAGADADLSADAKIRKLIVALGSENFKDRDDAEKQLQKMPEAIPRLEDALESNDVEIGNRCRRLIAGYKRSSTPKALERARTLAKAGKIELATEQLLDLDDIAENDAYWQTVLDVSNIVRDKAIEVHGKDVRKPFSRCPKTLEEYFERYRRPTFQQVGVSGGFIPKKGEFGGCVRADTMKSAVINGIAVFSGPNFSGRLNGHLMSQGIVNTSNASYSVIVSTSSQDQFPHLRARSSVVICRGNIEYLSRHENSIIITSGDIKKIDASIFSDDCVVKEKEPKPLGFIEWFETRQAGVEVSDTNNAIAISKLDEAKAFAMAGCKVGDRVLSVDDRKIGTTEDFRIALRKAVIRERARLRLQRDKETVTVRVTLKP